MQYTTSLKDATFFGGSFEESNSMLRRWELDISKY